MPDVRSEFGMSIAGTLATSSRSRRVMAIPGQIVGITVDCGTGPTVSGSLIVDIQKNGVSMYTTTTKPTVALGATKSAVLPAPDLPSFAAGDEIVLVPTAVGGTPAADMIMGFGYVGV